MNIVKGVADLIRRTSGGQTGESTSGPQVEKFSAPSPKIRFSEVGDEAILCTLWGRYENAIDKVEKRKLLFVFLKQFLIVYKNWEPVDSGQFLDTASSAASTGEYSSRFDDIVVGCSAGHPAEIILVLTEEVGQLTALVTELSGASTSFTITSEGFPVLDALKIVTRSMHNCRVFGYYGGIQKLTTLMKAAVVQLKTVASILSADESLSNFTVEKTGILQKVLVYVVSIICSFIDLHTNTLEKTQLYSNAVEFSVPRNGASSSDPPSSLKVSICETRLQWHQKAVVSVMEAGGLNWLVELLRVIRRLSMKEQWTDTPLQYVTLRTLYSALSENPRGQNHFRSIGGLEVLLDGLGLPPNNPLISKISCCSDEERDENPSLDVFRLHILSLEVLREAVFGNLNNLQFLCENGRVHKFANSFCLLAFMVQEYKQQSKDDFQLPAFDSINENKVEICIRKSFLPLPDNASYLQYWSDYAVKLNRVLCSFLLASEENRSHHVLLSTGRSAMPVSSVYGELSIKWIMRVLLTIFPCIKAFSNQNELPIHLRIFVNTLQNSVLHAFRTILVSSPLLLEVFREEGIWDLIFSENFFYFGPASEGSSIECCTYNEGSLSNSEIYASNYTDCQGKAVGVEILQMEVISFVEFAATFSGSAHNLPECSVLLDALEQSSCNPEIASILAKSLLRILQLSCEKTIASFKTLDAITRVLKVACIQAQEYGRPGNIGLNVKNNSVEVVSPQSCQRFDPSEKAQSCLKSMEASMDLLMEYISIADSDDAEILVLRSSTCVDCLFDLFWEKTFRNRVLNLILDLMKIVPFSDEDQRAKLRLCSKYLETFTQIKEREKSFAELSIDLLVGMRAMLLTDQVHYQDLFRDGECFLHVVSLLNGNLDEANGEKLVLNVLQTLTCLLARNDASKAAFRALVGKGYQTLQSLLLEFCQWRPSEGLLNALLDMLVDGKFDIKASPVIKNEDVIILYLSILQKSSDSSRHYGLNVFQQLLRDSISNRASCVRAGMLNFLLDWFSQEDMDSVILKIAQLIQVTGGHSISGKDIRKIFALLRSKKIGTQQKYCSLLLTSILSMLNEKGPTAFFDLNGSDSGVKITTPVQWPLNKGFSFSCWLRVESFPRNGTMGLFSFLTENGRGCLAALAKDKLIYESINQKRQCVSLHVNLVRKKWHFLCLTHSIGRAFSGGSQLRCYVDGNLASSEKCRYPKISELLTSCTIGTKINLPPYEEENALYSIKESSPFLGQIGPIYMFNDVITSEQVLGIYSLGPSYMYSFLDNEIASSYDNPLPSGILDAKDGLASKIIFGLNAQASDGRTLFNVSPLLDHALDKNSFEATVMLGTQLCSRRLLQQIIYCVGGVSVFFPLFSQSDRYENVESGKLEHTLLTPITKERLTAEVIELIASVLDENSANQHQMHLLSGFSILGFLLQSVPPVQLNLETLSALKHMFNVVANCGLSEVLVKDAISSVFLNPLIWVYTVYKVQRELYMFLIQQFDNDPRLLKSLCRLPRVIDIIRQFYWGNAKSRSAIGSKPLLHPITKQVIGERPSKEEIRKIRLLLLSLGEMSVRQNIAASDIKALVAFFETSQDMACIEDVLHMVIRAVSQKSLLASFLEQVNLIGGCHIFVNLLQREFEPVRLLGLQFLGRLLVGLPSEKKGPKFFNLAVGRSRSASESQRKISLRMQPIFFAMSDRLFRFSLTDNLCATLFDVLLGGASPKQVLQKHSHVDKHRSKASSSHFFLPQILVLIFRFLSGCGDASARLKIMTDLLDLLDSNPSNIEALMEYAWNAWLTASMRLDVLKIYKVESRIQSDTEINEQNLVRNLFCVVLCHYTLSVKGGWQHLEETVNVLVMHCEEGGMSYQYLLRDIYEDLIQRLVDISSDDNIFVSQPCRDNTLYLLRLVDEMLISELDIKLPLPASSSDFSLDSLDLESLKDLVSSSFEALHGESDDLLSSSRNPRVHRKPISNEKEIIDDKWWNIYDNLWIIISEMNGKGPSKLLPKSSSTVGPSFGQRARGLVESLNIPAAEMAAVVVSGGIGNALGGKPNKNVDKAMLLRGEKCPRIVFRLMILYLCRSSLERASRCVQQFIPLLSCLLAADDEHSKSRLQLFIWALVAVRSQYGMLNDGARFHVISHLIRETVNCGKSMLATSIVSREDPSDSGSNPKETGTIQNLIQKDRVLGAVSDEAKYIKTCKSERTRQLHELHTRLDENLSTESSHNKAFEDEIQSSLSTILASDDSRRAVYQLAHDEEQQNVAEKWMHLFRTLIDERGPWSANPFPNSAVRHWKLDKTEDAWRRRLKLRQNYHFDEKLCHPPSTSPSKEATVPINESKSGLGRHIPEQMKQFLLKGVHRITDEGTSETNENDADLGGQKASVSVDLSESQHPELVKDSSDQKDVQDRKDSSSSPPETEASEVLMSVACVLVTPKRKLAGYLAVMKNFLHFFGEFSVEGTGGSSVFKNLNTSSNSDLTKPDQLGGVQKQRFHKWPINSDFESEKGIISIDAIHENRLQKQPKNMKRHRRWNIVKIKSVHWTRYLLRYTAIEIFFNDSVAPIFFNFASQKDAKDVGTLIVATRNDSMFPKGSNRDKNGAISFVDRRVALEMAETARESWKRREMTNFEYLMILNTLAGRSYNDLTQYPVFPWVLADYSSEILDFNKSSTFRDLSKPVGALDLKRFEVFEDRYRNFCDPDIPSFYYGSHYSSMGIVLFYLLRLEPFTALHRNLQGGKFDHADRLFQSIEATYRNCLSNTSDVKELIPEFFYMPEWNDEAYDRFDAAAEEFRGLRLKQEQSRIDSGDGFQLVCGRKKKWGLSEMGQDSTVVAHSNVALAVKDKRTVGPAARPRVPFHIPTIPRPQDEFNILVNNSNQPFQHVWLQRSDDGLRFIHPLEKLSLLDFVDKNIGDLMPVMPPSIEDTPFKLVEEVRDLKELAAKLRSVNEFAVDLEHNQYRSFQGLTCLMQISTRTEDFVVDTLKLRIHVGPYLREVFKDPTKKKVMHGADRDIIWLQRDFGIYICNMFDTGQASRVLKLERNSLEHLLHHYCGVTANKEYQNADWRLRPLPDEMLRYAREDTHYLLHIYDLMRTQLLSMAEPENSNALLLEVYKRSFDICMQLYEKELLTDSSYLYTYGLQGAHFNAQQLAIVAGLFEWRDVVARAEDESTGYILPNKTLLEIAKQMPVTTSKLRRLLKSKHPYVERNLGPVVSIIRHSILNAAGFEAAAQHLKEGHIGTASEDNTVDTTGFEALPPESPTSIRAADARAESFDTDNVINGGKTDKLQTFVSAKEYHMEPGSTIDGPGSKGRGGSSEPPGESKEVKDEKDSFIPEVARETPASSGQSRDTETHTSVSQSEKVTEVTVQLLKKPNRAFGALLGNSASKRKLNSDPKGKEDIKLEQIKSSVNLPFHSFSGGNREELSKLDTEEHTKVLETQGSEEPLAVPASRNDLEEIIMFEENSGSDESVNGNSGAANEQLEGKEDNPKGSEMDEGNEPMSLTDLSSGFQKCSQSLNETRKARRVEKSQESNGLLQVKPFDYEAARKQVRFGEDPEESRGKEGRGGMVDSVSKKRSLGKGRVQGEDETGDYAQGRRRQAFPATGNRSVTFR